jgi:histidyl-tRNA synthetase
MSFRRLRGFKDFLPEESQLFTVLEEAARIVFNSSNCFEIRLPVLERVDLFKKSIGELTDIVEKEMFVFQDKDGEFVALRPEGTASVVRAYLENGYHISSPRIKLYYMGPMFRRERPQKGRLRQFHQIGMESFGFSEPSADADVISIVFEIYKKIGVEGIKIAINSLGCEGCRKGYKEELKKFLNSNTNILCEDCKRRAISNPLRFFDCKNEADELKEKAPHISEFLCEDCRKHFSDVIFLTREFPVIEDRKLVRGLDYYTRTVFEVYSEKEGREFVVAGGGRYDSLVKNLGGPDTPAVGFAIGCERTVILMAKPPVKRDGFFIASAGEEFTGMVFEVLQKIRKKGKRCDFSPSSGSLKSQIRRADALGMRFVIIIGEEEVKNGVLSIKDLENGKQWTIPYGDIDSLISY